MPKLKRASDRAKKYLTFRALGMDKGSSAVAAGFSKSTGRNAGRAIEAQFLVQHLAYRKYGQKSAVVKAIWALEEGINATKVAKTTLVIVERTNNDFQIIGKRHFYQRVPDQTLRLIALKQMALS